MENSVRLVVIGLVGTLLSPALCSAQMIILHENWHGMGSRKSQQSASEHRKSQRSLVHQQHERTILGTDNRNPQPGPPSVRVAEHRYHAPDLVDSSSESQVVPAFDIALTPTIPYDVIESPFRQPHREETLHVGSKHHPPITNREGPRTVRAVIPNTMQMPVWKTPYSYGYFGTSGTKHWYRHHGYRDRRTEWSYR